jgi:hypothetical protein
MTHSIKNILTIFWNKWNKTVASSLNVVGKQDLVFWQYYISNKKADNL